MYALNLTRSPENLSCWCGAELFTWRYYGESSPMPLYDVDVSPGEQRFLMITRDDNMAEPGRAEFKVVRNWTQELLERVPIP